MPRWLPYRHLCMDIFQKNDNNRKRAIVDASSAIILFKAGLFGRLAQTYRLLMTASVISEVTRSGYPGSEFFRDMGRRRAITIMSCDGRTATRSPRAMRLQLLDPGERDTIACFKEGRADFIIIDDGRGSGFCRDSGLPFINALLFPRILFLSGRFSAAVCEKKTARIIECGRYSQRIIASAGTMGLRELQFFLP